ncbi:hypothetical protein Tco_1581996, partial [Tanacetum coccineum]
MPKQTLLFAAAKPPEQTPLAFLLNHNAPLGVAKVKGASVVKGCGGGDGSGCGGDGVVEV